MNLTQYIQLATRTAKPMPTAQDHMEHAYLGLVTELGEIATSIKRATIYGKGFTPEILKNIREEIGDMLWYCALAMRYQPISVEVTDKVNMGEWLKDSYRPDPSTRPVGLIKPLVTLIETLQDLERSEYCISVVGLIMVNLAIMAAHFGFDMNEIAEENITKLRLRFPDAYSDEAAEGRADKGGLPASES